MKYARRLTGDDLLSMKHGPVLSRTLSLFRTGDELSSVWEEWIKGEADYCLGLNKKVTSIEDFDLFNQPIKEILEQTYQKYGKYGKWKIGDLSHTKKYCPEWQTPGNSCFPISIKEVLMSHGKTESEARKIIDFLQEIESLKLLWAIKAEVECVYSPPGIHLKARLGSQSI